MKMTWLHKFFGLFFIPADDLLLYSITIVQKLTVPIAPLCTVGGSDCYKPSQGFTSELVAPIRHVSALISFKCALGTFYCIIIAVHSSFTNP